MSAAKLPLPTIEQELARFGIRHERAEHSAATGKHRLYRGEKYLGEYSAAEAIELLEWGAVL